MKTKKAFIVSHSSPIVLCLLITCLLLIFIIFYGRGGGTQNRAPVVSSITVTFGNPTVNSSITLTCNATDADGDTLTYSWATTNGTLSATTGQTVTWTAPSSQGTHTVTVNVFDGKGGQVIWTENITVTVYIMASYVGMFDSNYQTLENLPYNLVNRVYIAFGQIVPKNGQCILDFQPGIPDEPANLRTIIDECRSENVQKILISIGCGGYTFAGENYHDGFHDAAQPENIDNFVESVVTFLENNNLDGIDLDLEQQSTTADDVLNLVKALRSRLENKYLLTITPWNPSLWSLDLKSIAPYVNQINLMYTYGYDNSVLDGYVTYLTNNGFMPKQIVAGVQSESPYDSIGTIISKCNYVKNNNLGGVMNWRLDTDKLGGAQGGAREIYEQLH